VGVVVWAVEDAEKEFGVRVRWLVGAGALTQCGVGASGFLFWRVKKNEGGNKVLSNV
jgi:hypothetical protein